MYAQILLVSIKFDTNDESYFLPRIRQSEISHKSLLLLHVDSDNRDDDRDSEASQVFVVCSALCTCLLPEA